MFNLSSSLWKHCSNVLCSNRYFCWEKIIRCVAFFKKQSRKLTLNSRRNKMFSTGKSDGEPPGQRRGRGMNRLFTRLPYTRVSYRCSKSFREGDDSLCPGALQKLRRGANDCVERFHGGFRCVFKDSVQDVQVCPKI
jgi:hypothetical protein